VLATYGADGPRVKQARVPSTALGLQRYVAAFPRPHRAVVESTGGWYWLADTLQPGQVERRTHDYQRHGTTSLYAGFNVQTGKVWDQIHPRQRSREFLRFLTQIDAQVPADLAIHVILDNASAHKSAAVRRWQLRHPRFHVHFTPTYASWMNLVERWFSALTTKMLQRGVHRSVRDLVAAIREFLEVHNASGKRYVWVKTAEQILSSIARFAQRTLAAHAPAS
jgi:transposase